MFGGFPLAAVFVVMLFQPEGTHAGATWFAAFLHGSFRTLYALVAIPYASMFARVTRDARLRADLAGFRMMFATAAAISVASGTLPLVHGLATPEDPRRGWIILAALFGGIALLLFQLVAWATKGYDLSEVETEPRPLLRASIQSLTQNRALILILCAVMISALCNTLFGKNLLYYFKYVVGREDLGGLALSVAAASTALFVPVFTVLARTIGKRAAWLCGGVPGLFGLVVWHMSDGMGTTYLFAALALCGVGSASAAVCFWSMLPDTVEYGEWKSGLRTESLVFGVAILGQKLALGLGAGLLGMLLGQIGYVANSAQTPATIAAIKSMMFWIPFLGGAASMLLISLYPITLDFHRRIVSEIAAKQVARKPEYS